MYNIKVKTETIGALLTVTVPEPKADKQALNNLLTGIPSFIVPFSFSFVDPYMEFRYPIKNYKILSQMPAGRSTEDYVNMWEDVLYPFLKTSDIKVNPFNLITNIKHLFCGKPDKNGKRIKYLYVPCVNECSSPESLSKMMSDIANTIPVRNKDLLDQVIQLTNANCSPEDLLKSILPYKSGAPVIVPVNKTKDIFADLVNEPVEEKPVSETDETENVSETSKVTEIEKETEVTPPDTGNIFDVDLENMEKPKDIFGFENTSEPTKSDEQKTDLSDIEIFAPWKTNDPDNTSKTETVETEKPVSSAENITLADDSKTENETVETEEQVSSSENITLADDSKTEIENIENEEQVSSSEDITLADDNKTEIENIETEEQTSSSEDISLADDNKTEIENIETEEQTSSSEDISLADDSKTEIENIETEEQVSSSEDITLADDSKTEIENIETEEQVSSSEDIALADDNKTEIENIETEEQTSSSEDITANDDKAKNETVETENINSIENSVVAQDNINSSFDEYKQAEYSLKEIERDIDLVNQYFAQKANQNGQNVNDMNMNDPNLINEINRDLAIVNQYFANNPTSENQNVLSDNAQMYYQQMQNTNPYNNVPENQNVTEDFSNVQPTEYNYNNVPETPSVTEDFSNVQTTEYSYNVPENQNVSEDLSNVTETPSISEDFNGTPSSDYDTPPKFGSLKNDTDDDTSNKTPTFNPAEGLSPLFRRD